jgi:hypothetical protein
MAYDPVPDLAALIDGLRRAAAQGNVDGTLYALGMLLTGPYSGLRGGLLLDEPGRENVSTEQAIREALAEFAMKPLRGNVALWLT